MKEDSGTQIAEIDAHVGRVTAGLDTTLIALNDRMAGLDSRFESIDDRMEAVRQEMNQIDSEELDELKEKMSTAIGEAVLVRIEMERLEKSLAERFDNVALRVTDVETQLADATVDVSTAVQLERLEELERAVIEIDPTKFVTRSEFQRTGTGCDRAHRSTRRRWSTENQDDGRNETMALRKPKADEGSLAAVSERPGGETTGRRASRSASRSVRALCSPATSTVSGWRRRSRRRNGDLAEFGQLLLTKHGVGRAEYARALATACGIPLGDTRATEINPELAQRIDERLAAQVLPGPDRREGRQAHRVLGRSGQGPPRRRRGRRRPEVRVVGHRPQDGQSFIEQIWRSDADIGRLVATFQATDSQIERAEEANEVNLDDQAPVVQLVNRIVRPGAPRPRPSATSTSSRSTTTCASGSASTASSSRRSTSR